jgi:hypothetical protein
LHTHTKQAAAGSESEVELLRPYLSTHSPWPEQESVWLVHEFSEVKHCGMGLALAFLVGGGAAGSVAGLRLVLKVSWPERTASASRRRRRSAPAPAAAALQWLSLEERLDSGSRTRRTSRSPSETKVFRRGRLERRESSVSGD